MIWIARLLVALLGVIFVIIGIGTMLDPSTLMNDFGLVSPALDGRSAVRADMGAFFVCSGGFALASLFPGQRHWLLGAIALFIVAFLGRLFGVFMESGSQGIISAMLIEAASIAILVFAYVVFGIVKRQAENEATAAQTNAPTKPQLADKEPAAEPVVDKTIESDKNSSS